MEITEEQRNVENQRKDKSIFKHAAVKYGLLLILNLAATFAWSETLIIGNDYIASATDTMLAGEEVVISAFILPLIAMVSAGSLAAFISSLSGKHYSTYIQKYVRSRLGSHIMELPYAYFDEKGSGSIMNKLISDMSEAGRFFSEILPELLVNLITVITISVYLGQMDLMILVVLFATYPVMLVVADWLSKKIAAVAKKRRNSMDDRTEVAYDAVQGIVVGRSYNLYNVMKDRIDGIIDDIALQGCKSTRITSSAWVIKTILTTIPVIICYLFALNETVAGKITTGEMLAFTVLLGRILWPLGDVVFCINDLREAGVSLKRIDDIYKEEAEQQGSGDYEFQEPVIEWKDVTFAYNDSKNVLKGMNFSVKAGEHIAFAGGSGEGKSTIFRILCGFYQKNGGTYKLAGHDYEDWNLRAARRNISLVSQNVFLFPETIRQNVAYGRMDATEEEIIQACKYANIHEFIESLPEGYDTMVGERGVLLSGGERQRISIARAFLKNAPILLLDEPTAAIDPGTESMIQEAINRVSIGRTVIIIAHRLSTIQNSDRIYVVADGTVAEEGTHKELLALKGIYAGMYGKEVAASEG